MMWTAEGKCLTVQTHLFWSSTPGTMTSIEGMDRAFIGQGTTHKILAESCQSIKAGWGGNAGCDRSDPSIHPSNVPPSLPLCRCGSAQSLLGPRTLLLSRSPRVARCGRHIRAFLMETSWDQEVRPTRQNVGKMTNPIWDIGRQSSKAVIMLRDVRGQSWWPEELWTEAKTFYISRWTFGKRCVQTWFLEWKYDWVICVGCRWFDASWKL